MARLLTASERRLLEKMLKEQHGVESPFKEFVLLMMGEGRVRAATREAFEIAERLKRVQQVGLYVAKLRKGEVNLSIEGSQLLGEKLKRNVIELGEEEAREWMSGAPIKIEIQVDSRYIIAKHDRIYLGSGRVSRDGKAYPQVAKWRRIPEQ